MRPTTHGEPAVLLASAFGDEESGGGLFALDGERAARVDRLGTHGLAVRDERLVRVLRSASEVGGAGELLVYDARGVVGYHRVDALADPHGIAWDGERYVVVSTLANELLWLDADGSVARRWSAPGQGDCWHLNSVLVEDGRVYVSAFGRYGQHREWAGEERRLEPNGFVFDVTDGREVVSGLTTPHDPRLVEGSWLVCNSGRAELVQVEAGGAVSRRARLAGWTRGLAVCDELIAVGESANRRDLARRATASIAFLDRLTWELIARVDLPAQEIYDVVAVPPSLVAGVRRGFRTNVPRVAEHDQLALFARAGVEPVRVWASGTPLPRDGIDVRISARPPASMRAGSLAEVPCTLENRAGAILVSVPPNPVVLSYRWVDPDSGAPLDGSTSLRSPLPAPAHPREPLACSLKVLAPAEAGDYGLRITLLQERVGWFDDVDAANGCSSLVRVTAPA